MCFTVTISKEIDYLQKRFDAAFADPGLFEPMYYASAFTLPRMPVITNDDISEIRMLTWGLVPSWIKDERSADNIRFKTFNARAETLHEKPSFRHSIREKRCLVLGDGFFEWREFARKKYPYYIRFKDRKAFALAGIWDKWENGKSIIETFSIITTRANALMEKIHNTKKRMPVILKEEHEKRWLSDDLNSDELNSLLDPYDDKNMEAYTISKLITRSGAEKNVSRVIEKFEYPELQIKQSILF